MLLLMIGTRLEADHLVLYDRDLGSEHVLPLKR